MLSLSERQIHFLLVGRQSGAVQDQFKDALPPNRFVLGSLSSPSLLSSPVKVEKSPTHRAVAGVK